MATSTHHLVAYVLDAIERFERAAQAAQKQPAQEPAQGRTKPCV
jgi:hypothetical protein